MSSSTVLDCRIWLGIPFVTAYCTNQDHLAALQGEIVEVKQWQVISGAEDQTQHAVMKVEARWCKKHLTDIVFLKEQLRGPIP